MWIAELQASWYCMFRPLTQIVTDTRSECTTAGLFALDIKLVFGLDLGWLACLTCKAKAPLQAMGA